MQPPVFRPLLGGVDNRSQRQGIHGLTRAIDYTPRLARPGTQGSCCFSLGLPCRGYLPQLLLCLYSCTSSATHRVPRCNSYTTPPPHPPVLPLTVSCLYPPPPSSFPAPAPKRHQPHCIPLFCLPYYTTTTTNCNYIRPLRRSHENHFLLGHQPSLSGYTRSASSSCNTIVSW